MNNIVYGVEKWDDARKEWVPHRFDCKDLAEVGEVIDLLEQVMPDREFRPVQYTVKEFQYIKSFG